MPQADLQMLYEQQYIDVADWHFARSIQRMGKCDDPWVAMAAALVSRWASSGHVCLDLDVLRRQGLQNINAGDTLKFSLSAGDWRARLQACPAVGGPGDFSPLILDRQRLYLHRYWTYEQRLGRAIMERCAQPAPRIDATLLDAALAELFPEGESDQRSAAQLAATRLFSVISGGPGTGKTYTVAKIIVLLHLLHSGQPLKIFLAAPTGKAAARLQEAVTALLKNTMAIRPDAMADLPNAQTLHRLLGYMPTSAQYHYGADNPLPADAVIVDEASMIDLGLMHQLVQALPTHCRLLLVGDKDQLASVEAGAVLGDICHGAAHTPITNAACLKQPLDKGQNPSAGTLLGQHIKVLEHSYRFDARSGIGALAQAINAGDAKAVSALLADDHLPAIVLRPLSAWNTMLNELEEEIATSVASVFDAQSPGEAFSHLSRFKILSAVRKGPFGVEALNHAVEQLLRRQGRIAPAALLQSPWYHGRPVMITRNDYHHGLFNGDVGIAMARTGPAGQEMQVLFPGPEGSYKDLAPHQLSEHETVYAMTIHKSQGSEFERVMVVLPDADLPLLTRELIYTAVTRARKSIVIWADPQLLALAVQRPIQRSSGLRGMLWGR